MIDPATIVEDDLITGPEVLDLLAAERTGERFGVLLAWQVHRARFAGECELSGDEAAGPLRQQLRRVDALFEMIGQGLHRQPEKTGEIEA